MKYLIINRGSASEKYAIYTASECLVFLHLEKSETECGYTQTLYINEQKEEGCITKEEFASSLNYALSVFIKKGIILNQEEIAGIGIRVVAPGHVFQTHRIIDEAYEQEIKKVIQSSPLHLLPTFEMIQSLKKIFFNIPIVGVSDSAFHNTIPSESKYYAIPWADTEKYQLERYGYHGISVASVLTKLEKEQGMLPRKIIVCHIGSGVSITAIKDGQSVENSMGFTPLEGVIMSTRAGNIDPGAMSFLLRNIDLSHDKLADYLNKKCGLLGVSGQSSDVRDLLKLEQEGDTQAKLALNMYVYQLQKNIGAYYTILGGLDMIIFTATVGERSFIIRERICQGLSVLGIVINKDINNQSEGIDADISATGPVKVLVRKTDEMSQIASDTIKILNS